ncbi:MAG: M15 family metallopeptidase [Ginsengibacter sp.]
MKWILRNKFWLHFFPLTVFMLFISLSLFSQSKVSNNNGLSTVNHIRELSNEIAKNPDNQMINVKKAIPSIVLDLKYATTNNFMHQKLYPPVKTTYLRSPAAVALKKVVEELAVQGLGIKIWDAYRPYAVTKLMWEKIKDPRYVADPSKGSGHNRGISVDLTLINLSTGEELSMPTGFDNFSDTAHALFSSLPPEILTNRKVLKTVMEKYGFIQLETEWWHFYLPHSSDFSVLNLSFKQLRKMDK